MCYVQVQRNLANGWLGKRRVRCPASLRRHCCFVCVFLLLVGWLVLRPRGCTLLFPLMLRSCEICWCFQVLRLDSCTADASFDLFSCNTQTHTRYGAKAPGQLVGGRWKPLQYLYKQSVLTDVATACGVSASEPNLKWRCYIKNDRGALPLTGMLQVRYVRFADRSIDTVITVPLSMGAGPGVIHWVDLPDTHTLDGKQQRDSLQLLLSSLPCQCVICSRGNAGAWRLCKATRQTVLNYGVLLLVVWSWWHDCAISKAQRGYCKRVCGTLQSMTRAKARGWTRHQPALSCAITQLQWYRRTR